MSRILPVSDLRNYNEVLNNCKEGQPVFLTKNGRGRFVVIDINDYEKYLEEKKLMSKLREAADAVKSEDDWLDMDSLRKAVGIE